MCRVLWDRNLGNRPKGDSKGTKSHRHIHHLRSWINLASSILKPVEFLTQSILASKLFTSVTFLRIRSRAVCVGKWWKENAFRKRLSAALGAKMNKCALNSPFASCLLWALFPCLPPWFMSLFSSSHYCPITHFCCLQTLLPPHLLPTDFCILSSSSTSWFWTSEIQSPLTIQEHGHLPICTELLKPCQHSGKPLAAEKIPCIPGDSISCLHAGWWNDLCGENWEPDGGVWEEWL